MGRVNYTLSDRYTLSVTGRADGSSRLAPGHKWAFFPSFGLGVAARRRGVHAALQVPQHAQGPRQLRHDRQHRRSTRTRRRVCSSPRVYSFGSTLVRGYRRARIPNPDLGWEKTDQTDVGIEYALVRRPHLGQHRRYRYSTHDLLLTRRSR